MAARLSSLARFTRVFGAVSSHKNAVGANCLLRNVHLSSINLGDAIKIKMPSLSPTMYEGSIVEWHKKEGDTVSAGEILCDIQTDKAVVGFEIEEDGVLAKILVTSDTGTIKIGTLIGLMVEEGDDWQNVEIPADSQGTASEDTPPTVTESSESTAVPASSNGNTGVIGPAVRGLLDLYNISASEIQPSGPHNNLLKGDVLNYVKSKGLKAVTPQQEAVPSASIPTQPPPTQPSTAPASTAPAVSKSSPPPPALVGAEFSDLELTNMRKVIAKRLTESKTTTPHAYSTINCKISKLLELRKEFKDDGISVSVNDFIIKACAVALQRVPEVNSVWTGEEGQMLSNIDISVAVATDNGLITPIVKDAIGLGLAEISSTIKGLAAKAKEGKLKPQEFQGGTFTISNLGMFGISEFTAVINPPQACILAVGGSQLEIGLDGRPQTMMKVTMSSDARIVDEFLAAKFLEVFRDVIESPVLMLSQSVQQSLRG